MLHSVKWDGKPISTPGMFEDVPIDVYHSQKICAGPSVSSSGLRRALEVNGGSPAHFFNEWSGNQSAVEAEEEKAHFIMGRAVHHLILGQPAFMKQFVIRPTEYKNEQTGELKPWHNGANVCKLWMSQAAMGGAVWIEQKQRWIADKTQGPVTVLAGEQVDHIKGMAKSLGMNSLVQEGILNGMIERSIIYKDKATGLFVKARPDAIPTHSGDYADLKTTTSTQYLDIARSLETFAYHQQAALIRTASREVFKMELSSYSLVFVEKKPPYCVRVVPLEPADLDLGEQQNRFALDLIARCIKNKRWPGPGGDNIASIRLFDGYRARAMESMKEEGQ